MIEANKLNFNNYWSQGNFKFKSEFEIKSIKEIVEVAHGENFKQVTQIGRILGMDTGKQYTIMDGEIILKDGQFQLDGYGRSFSEKAFCQGLFKLHQL